MIFSLLRLVHVFAAVLALGTNLTYFFWMRRAEQQPEALEFALRGIQGLDRRLANPAYLTILALMVLKPRLW